jgi:hypothetical protein
MKKETDFSCFKATIIAPIFTQIPPEIVEKWAEHLKSALPKAYKTLKKSIRSRADLARKIARPTQKDHSPDYSQKK